MKLANEQNLRPFTSDQDREEAKKNGQKGGVASGEARRRKADLRKTLETLLQGKDAEGKTYEEQVALGLMLNAINGKKGGNPKAYEVIAKMLGQYESKNEENNTTPTLKIEIVDNEKIIKGDKDE